mgnify:CR=1 FL=1
MSAAFSASASRVSSNLAQKVAASENETAPGAAGKGKDAPGLLQNAARGIGWMIEREKEISALFASVPYPGQPAARYFDLHFGMPHGHMHKPTMGVPLPSIGPLLYIPYVSGAGKVTINNQVAMRCGDFGLSAWCGGYMPMNEIFFGSATVWIESARAARSSDITDHCILFDPPMIGVAKGYVTNGSADVKIGGMPMPSLTQAAIGLAMKPVMKQLGKAAKKGARAAKPLFKRLGKVAVTVEQKALARFLARVEIMGSLGFKKAVIADLKKLAGTRSGRSLMNEVMQHGQQLKIHPGSRACAKSLDLTDFGRTKPSGGRIEYSAGDKLGSNTSDEVLMHELSHVNNMGRGSLRDGLYDNSAEYQRWKNPEEKGAVAWQNLYQAEKGRPIRDRYWNPVPERDSHLASLLRNGK